MVLLMTHETVTYYSCCTCMWLLAGAGAGVLIYEMNRRSHISLPCRDLCVLGTGRGPGSVFHKSVIVFPSSILLHGPLARRAATSPSSPSLLRRSVGPEQSSATGVKLTTLREHSHD